MMQTSKLLLILVFAAGVSNSCSQSASSPADPYLQKDWAKNALWDDGKAEVITYDAERVVYGKSRSFEYTYVLVKETFNKEYQVKTDAYDRNDLYEVMKINKFCRIPTMKYPYHYLTSVFLKRDDASLVHKLTNTSQEWCGNTAKSFVEDGNNYRYQYMSYWDGQGNGTDKLRKGPWFEDQLSYTLRTLNFEEGITFDILLYPMQISSRANQPEAEIATISITKAYAEDLSDIDPAFVSNPWKVNVSRAEGPDLSFWINGEYPNYLLRMKATDGRKLSMKSLIRDAYWEHE
jgi:hypothetical protein